jgi:hypothetical protein
MYKKIIYLVNIEVSGSRNNLPGSRLSITQKELSIRVPLTGRWNFKPEDIVSFDFAKCSSGTVVSLNHTIISYPRTFRFLIEEGQWEFINLLKSIGFLICGNPEHLPSTKGIPVKWSFIVFATAIWNLYFILGITRFFTSIFEVLPSRLFPIIPLAVVFLVCLCLPKSKILQWLTLKPGRHVGELSAFLSSSRLLTGLMIVGIIFSKKH